MHGERWQAQAAAWVTHTTLWHFHPGSLWLHLGRMSDSPTCCRSPSRLTDYRAAMAASISAAAADDFLEAVPGQCKLTSVPLSQWCSARLSCCSRQETHAEHVSCKGLKIDNHHSAPTVTALYAGQWLPCLAWCALQLMRYGYHFHIPCTKHAQRVSAAWNSFPAWLSTTVQRDTCCLGSPGVDWLPR